MNAHSSTLISRMIRAGLWLHGVRYRVIAAGIDNRDRIISLHTNQPYLPSQGRHAEERVIFSSPRSLARIILLRVAKNGELLPIDPCERCKRLADKRKVVIESIR